MGILNVTPDSFSDGGLHDGPESAIGHGAALLANGADLVDVGGESTRPGAAPVAVADELARVLPVIEGLAAHTLGDSQSGVIAIDTRKEAVARAAIASGASMINDVSASMAAVAADLGVPWIAMHMQGEPETMQHAPHYEGVVDEVLRFLDAKASEALAMGVPEVWIDPGVGFGKTFAHNMALIRALDRFVATGHPVLLGASRKSFLGKIVGATMGLTGPAPVSDRLESSVATALWGMIAGVEAVRVHDVGATRNAADVLFTYSQ